MIVILLLLTSATGAFGQNLLSFPETLEIELIDFLRPDFKLAYHLVRPSRAWTLFSGNYEGAVDRIRAERRPIITLGSIPDVLFKYQSDTLFQWGYPLRYSILSLRIGVKADDLEDHHPQPRRGNGDILNLYLNFNFLIDIWFK